MMHWIFPFAAGVFVGASIIAPITYLLGKGSACDEMSTEIRERREALSRQEQAETVGA